MARLQIFVSDEILARLKDLAEPFVDHEPEDVIRKLLDEKEAAMSRTQSPIVKNLMRPFVSRNSVDSRVPRERGTTVELGDYRIKAVSVSDLYKQVLRFLVENHKTKLEKMLPFSTSKERYLIAQKPVHPSGHPFFVEVEFDGFYMEGHKDYKNAIRHLQVLIQELGLNLSYVR